MKKKFEEEKISGAMQMCLESGVELLMSLVSSKKYLEGGDTEARTVNAIGNTLNKLKPLSLFGTTKADILLIKGLEKLEEFLTEITREPSLPSLPHDTVLQEKKESALHGIFRAGIAKGSLKSLLLGIRLALENEGPSIDIVSHLILDN
jgi:hypothetical protein